MNRILCLSNGHGEDAIATRILRQLREHPRCPELAALPLVGEGNAYQTEGIPIIGPVQSMPSGGFVYMDGRQLWGDLRGGLISLTCAQLRAVRHWAKAEPTTNSAVLAVGDIVPLLFGWASGAAYAFVGTAKSEYYIRDEAGWLQRPISKFELLERWSGSVYLPQDQWLMKRDRCRAVFPRDSLTADILQQQGVSAWDLGNPMMDDLLPNPLPEALSILAITLLPGSRVPEAYRNWETMLPVVEAVAQGLQRPMVFLAAIAPTLEVQPLESALVQRGWQPGTAMAELPAFARESDTLIFSWGNATLLLTATAYRHCLWLGDVAIAMAGTATEQFVGLGKPAITLPGKGPQFTYSFAEAQSRHLGKSVIFLERSPQAPARAPAVIQKLLSDPDRLQQISLNGRRRMGEPGAAKRIADRLMEIF